MTKCEARALIVVDVQNDFLPGGSLAVRDGDQIIPIINRLMHQSLFDVIVATQDWHPPDHTCFATNRPTASVGDVVDIDGVSQILWPVHCVQGTQGAEFDTRLDLSRIDQVVRKGTNVQADSYSGFRDNGGRHETELATYLHDRSIAKVYVAGLATDYCVKFTALDAASRGFDTTLIADACRGVELKPGDVTTAITEMRTAGIGIVESAGIVQDDDANVDS
jgi:nicotinamidase/pyrazinamidase